MGITMYAKQLFLFMAIGITMKVTADSGMPQGPSQVPTLGLKMIGKVKENDAQALRRAYELISVINLHDAKQAAEYITNNYSRDWLSVPIEEHRNCIMREYYRSGGFKILEIKELRPTHVELLIQMNLTEDRFIFIVNSETEEPFLINGWLEYSAEKGCKYLSKQTIITELDTFVKKLVDANIFSGAILLAHQGKPFYVRAFGDANKDFNVPNTVDTKFNLGSMNKMFTAVAIAQLVEQGKLSFEDSLCKFLPDFPNPLDSKKIRIKHLLTHTSGLGSFLNKKFEESSRALFRTIDDMLKLIDDTSIAFEPGSKWQYSNTGYLILGAIIEQVSGQSYFDYVREHIYKPAGMTNTDCYELDKVNSNLAVGYIQDFAENGCSFRNNIFLHVLRGGPAGGGYSTVYDLLKFDRALRENKLIGQELKKQLFTAKPELNSPDYGYGFIVTGHDCFVGHNGGFEGINAEFRMYLKNDLTVAILSNYTCGAMAVNDKISYFLDCMFYEDKAGCETKAT